MLPKAGFSSPITETVLPHTFTGTWTGTWTTLPESTPGDADGGTLGTRVGDGQARTRENQTTGGSRSGDDLLDHYSS